MSKGRISSASRKTRQTTLKASQSPVGRVIRFLGVSLGGGKTDKACVVVLEFYPEHKKIFLSRVFEKIKSEGAISGDLKIHEIYELYRGEFESICFDVPLSLPLCLSCNLKCPGFEACEEDHIKWFWKQDHQESKKKRPRKLFTPYTQRAVEWHLMNQLEEKFEVSHAMGSNSAPLLARARFIARRFKSPCIEVQPKVSVWRIGSSLGVMKSHIKYHRHSVGGDLSRREILAALNDKNFAFVYDQDVKLMIENNHAFEAFICAVTGFLKYRGLTVKKPAGFPSHEAWVEYPVENIPWSQVLNFR